MGTSAPARCRQVCSARIAFALRDLEGLTVENFEDSVPASVVALFRLISVASLAGCGRRPWATRRGEREFGVTDSVPAARKFEISWELSRYFKHRITVPFIERGLPAALRTRVPA